MKVLFTVIKHRRVIYVFKNLLKVNEICYGKGCNIFNDVQPKIEVDMLTDDFIVCVPLGFIGEIPIPHHINLLNFIDKTKQSGFYDGKERRILLC